MTVEVKMTDEDYARVVFNRFLANNNRSTDMDPDGTYHYRDTQNAWVAFVVGFRAGRDSADGQCDF